MSGMTTYSDISQRTTVYAEAEMLAHAEPILVLERFALTKPLPKNKAETIKFRRPIPFAVTTTALVEGVTPAPQAMRYEDVEVTMSQYGGWTVITDRVHDLSEDPVLKDATMLSAEQAAETKEQIVWGVLKGGTNVFYGAAADTARTDVNDAISTERQRAIVRFLKQQRAKPLSRILASTPNYDTTHVERGYFAFAHTDLERDIREMTNFRVYGDYGSTSKALPGEIGRVEDVRYICSPLLQPFEGAGSGTANGMETTGGNVDVYPVVYVGQDAYGVVPLKGAGSMSPRVKNPGQISDSDPLGQRGMVSWKMWFAALRLNEAWMARLEVGATAL